MQTAVETVDNTLFPMPVGRSFQTTLVVGIKILVLLSTLCAQAEGKDLCIIV